MILSQYFFIIFNKYILQNVLKQITYIQFVEEKINCQLRKNIAKLIRTLNICYSSSIHSKTNN